MNSIRVINKYLFIALLMLMAAPAFSQDFAEEEDDIDDVGTNSAPIDDYIGFVAAAGILYGITVLKKRKQIA